ncbi:hypothetical protein ABB29_02605 [Pseudoxanthomonas dokdonensis]|uniref:Uncharacterized protein n=2 Tax=Pseudoxanthomonas dokdonensis TaxID=344882 RepID=A0A0R0CZP1_9GAMM|nr:hypothetical protein ABB29_02605 [Pseudoxanthomonas dokdonensis]
MEPRNQPDRLQQTAMATAAFEKLLARLEQQVEQSQAVWRRHGEEEHARLQQAMQVMFQQQQQRTEVALRPKVLLAWQVVAGTALLLILLLAGGLLLLKQTYASLHAAQAQLEATQIELQERQPQ